LKVLVCRTAVASLFTARSPDRSYGRANEPEPRSINVAVSFGKSGSSRSRQEARELTFDVSNPAELDRGRAVVLTSGAPVTLVRTMPWYTGPHKDAVEASIKKYSPRPEEPAVLVPAAPAANPWIMA
jgi:hypothetical protein